jgi:predicted YcjX-like family ATPase
MPLLSLVGAASLLGASAVAVVKKTTTKHIVVTGLSRSGKSTLFTSLMAQLIQRSQAQTTQDSLPFLTALPINRIEKVSLYALDNVPFFPYQQNMQALVARQWPAPTTNITAFALEIRLRRSNKFIQKALSSECIRFEIYDYPGEWLMDLPMMHKSYTDWSAQVLAQQQSEPQLSLAKDWQQTLIQFDFDTVPTPERVSVLVDAYRQYLLKAKADGVSILQPGALLLPPDDYDWPGQGFCPLPSKVTCDKSHAWFLVFNKHYQHFIKQWIKPLSNRFFSHADKQIMLIDPLEGLHYGRDYLAEMKEAMSHLTSSFVYGKRSWFESFYMKPTIAKVAFVATKADLIPHAEYDNMLLLLKELTQGARSHFDKDVAFEHFMVASLVAANAAEDGQSFTYKDVSGDTIRARFSPIPTRLGEWKVTDCYPYLKALPPKINSEADIRSIYLDKLLNYMIRD